MSVCTYLKEDNKDATILIYFVLIMCQLDVLVFVIYCYLLNQLAMDCMSFNLNGSRCVYSFIPYTRQNDLCDPHKISSETLFSLG
jgi:hypothetical protein